MSVSLEDARRMGRRQTGRGSSPTREAYSGSLAPGNPGTSGCGNCARTLCAFWRIAPDTGRPEMRWMAVVSR
jgi:hypothetical protein